MKILNKLWLVAFALVGVYLFLVNFIRSANGFESIGFFDFLPMFSNLTFTTNIDAIAETIDFIKNLEWGANASADIFAYMGAIIDILFEIIKLIGSFLYDAYNILVFIVRLVFFP